METIDFVHFKLPQQHTKKLKTEDQIKVGSSLKVTKSLLESESLHFRHLLESKKDQAEQVFSYISSFVDIH